MRILTFLILLLGFAPGVLAQTAISALPSATSLGTTDVFPIVQGGTTKKVATSVMFDSPAITTKINLPRVTAFPGSPVTGDVVIVTDDSAVGACDSAAGSAVSVCYYNGSAWITVGDGPGEGNSFTLAGTLTDGNLCKYTSSGTTVDCNIAPTAAGRIPNSTSATATSFTATPTLGASGTLGSLTMGNATSGTLTIQPVTGALGTVTVSVPAATDTLVGKATTDTFTNKTFDSQGTGNVLKFLDTIQLTHPHNCDGTGATISTTATAIDYGRATYSHSADQASNYCEYRLNVPFDLDTGTEWTAQVKFRLNAGDTGTHRYVLSTVTQADSAAAAGTPGTAINLDFAGDASGASGDIESVGFTTLTGWAATMTADRLLVIRLARDGDATEDGSTQTSTVMNLTLKYGRSQ